jgi:hypothetical protein
LHRPLSIQFILRLMAVAPKGGHLYGFNLATNSRIRLAFYRMAP